MFKLPPVETFLVRLLVSRRWWRICRARVLWRRSSAKMGSGGGRRGSRSSKKKARARITRAEAAIRQQRR